MADELGNDGKKGLLDRSFETLEKQMQLPCWNKKTCKKMKEFGKATDNARVKCKLLIKEDSMDLTETWKMMTPRDVFQYNNPDSTPEDSHSATKKLETEEKLRRHQLLPGEDEERGVLQVVLNCHCCGSELATIKFADTIEHLYKQELRPLVVHDKTQPLIYNQSTKLDPDLPDDAAKVCALTHLPSVNEFVQMAQSPAVLERIRRSLEHGKLQGILHQKSLKAERVYADSKKTYIRIGLGFKDFEKFRSQPVLELWPLTYSSPIHQHGGCAGSVRIIHGQLDSKFYESLQADRPMRFRRGDCKLDSLPERPQEVLQLKAGDTTWLNRQSWFVHAVECSNDHSIEPREFALSIHFYMSCTDEFAFVSNGEQPQTVMKAQPKNDLFWNFDLPKDHPHYLKHYQDADGNQIPVPDFETEILQPAQLTDPANGEKHVDPACVELAIEGGGEVNGKEFRKKQCYLEALKLDPNDAKAWYKLGCQGGGEVNGQVFNKVQCYLEALKVDRNFALAWFSLGAEGGGEVNGQEFSKKHCYLEALKLDRNYAKAWYNLGCEGGGEVNDQEFSQKHCYLEALKVDRNYAKAWVGLGYEGGGEVNGQEFSKKQCDLEALKLDRNYAKAWVSLGYEGGGEVNGQEFSRKQCYLEALKLDRNYAKAWNNLGAEGGGEVNGQEFSKKQCFLEALKLDRNYAHAWNNLGAQGGGEVNGQEFSGKQCFLEALKLDPNYATAWNNLGAEGGG